MTYRIDDQQLRSPRRLRLLAVMEAHPGRTFRGLVRAAGIPSGSCAHHVRILERHGLAWSAPHGSRRRHFAGPRPAEATAAVMVRLAGLDAGMAAVLAFVEAKPGCAQQVVLAAFQDRPKSTVQHILHRLERDGLLRRMPSGRCRRYVTVPQIAGLRPTPTPMGTPQGGFDALPLEAAAAPGVPA